MDRLCGLAVKTLAQRSGGTGSIPGRVKPRTFKLVLVADPPGVWHYGFSAKYGRPGVRIMSLGNQTNNYGVYVGLSNDTVTHQLTWHDGTLLAEDTPVKSGRGHDDFTINMYANIHYEGALRSNPGTKSKFALCGNHANLPSEARGISTLGQQAAGVSSSLSVTTVATYLQCVAVCGRDYRCRAAEFNLDLLTCMTLGPGSYTGFTANSQSRMHEELFHILDSLDIDGKDPRILKTLYWKQTDTVRVGGEHSEETPITRGVRQGCILSPDLFNLYSEMILRELDNIQGIGLGGHNINNMRYADDTVLIAQSEQSLQKMLDIVVKESEIKGLSLNIAKTESMTISKKPQAPSCKIRSNGTQVKQVNQFKYLGYMLTSDGKCETEIRKRIITSKTTFKKLSPLMTNRNIHMDTKIRILKAYVWSVLIIWLRMLDNEQHS
ncbi:endonuclease-reverse transcriptase [Elysia marginata]|uniref:Endonuclease-reverse transcriptase n=1 Tax=Elysia marginata TaxID=1093978 RepID=A0AAV4I0T5_9GAST|nr:endonuclease-reverse transcriptase [Elysia marginata]